MRITFVFLFSPRRLGVHFFDGKKTNQKNHRGTLYAQISSTQSQA
jgi:hypothetical protein